MTASVAVDGYILDDLLAQGVQGNSGLLVAAAKRGANIPVAGRDGTVHVPRKRHGEAVVVLPLWARGVNPDGTLPGDDPAAQRACVARVRELTKRFTVGDRVTIRHTLTDASVREIRGEVTDSIDWTTRGTGRDTLGQATIALTCADPFWADVDNTTATITSGTPQLLVEFAAASARMVDLVVTFGPSSNPALTQGAVVLGYNGVIASGRRLEVDAGRYTARGLVDGGGEWTPGTAPTQHIRRIRHEGDPTLWVLDPGIPAPMVQLTHTGGGAATATITGRQKHKIG